MPDVPFLALEKMNRLIKLWKIRRTICFKRYLNWHKVVGDKENNENLYFKIDPRRRHRQGRMSAARKVLGRIERLGGDLRFELRNWTGAANTIAAGA